MVDTHAAARMELRSMPGALACLSATGQDAGTKMTDDEMRKALADNTWCGFRMTKDLRLSVSSA